MNNKERDKSIILCTNCIHYDVCCDENWEDPAMQYCGERLVKVE